MKKKILSILLTIAMIVTMMPVMASAYTGELVVEKTSKSDYSAKQLKALSVYEVKETFCAYVNQDGKKIRDLGGEVVTVGVEFTPEKGRARKDYKIYRIDSDGSLHKCKKRYVDGKFVFKTSTLSDYALIYMGTNGRLLAKTKVTGDRRIRLQWTRIAGATKYVVYAARCGEPYKKAREFNDKFERCAIYKVNGKRLKPHKVYKFVIVAYKGKKRLTKSNIIHVIAARVKKKRGNVKSVTTNKKQLTMYVGQSKKIKGTYKVVANKKHLSKSHGQELRYYSNNPKVVRMTRTGYAKARKKGLATIYVQDIGGRYAKIFVVVK